MLIFYIIGCVLAAICLIVGVHTVRYYIKVSDNPNETEEMKKTVAMIESWNIYIKTLSVICGVLLSWITVCFCIAMAIKKDKT